MNVEYDVIVIGSGPAGLTASMYLARAGYKVCNITGLNPGGQLININNLENYPGYKSISGYDLWEIMVDQCKSVGVTFFEYANVVEHEKNGDEQPNIITYSDGVVQRKIRSKAVITCIGGKHKSLNLPNEQLFFGKGISFCATCDGPYYKNKIVWVVGGGNTAIDYAITLSKYCKEVHIAHRRNELRATKDMVDKIKNISNIYLHLNTIVTELKGTKKLEQIVIKDNDSFKECVVLCDCLFYAIGFKFENIPCRISGLHSGTFAAGDYSTEYHQVITAAGDGCRAALDCIKFLQENL